MDNPVCIGLASKAIAAKAERLSSSAATAKRDASELRRQARALAAIAEAVGRGPTALRDWVKTVHAAPEGAITSADLERAGIEVYSLAMRKESKSTVAEADLPSGDGWEPGGDGFGLFVHRETLQQAIDLYALATALHNEEYWTYMKGLLLHRLGDYAAAVQAFDSLQGPYAQFGAQQASQCRMKMTDGPAAKPSPDVAFGNVLGELEERLSASSSLFGGLKDLLGQLGLPTDFAPEPEPEPASDPTNSGHTKPRSAADGSDAKLEQAALTAQTFAEFLANGDYASAHALLGSRLRREIGVRALEQNYRQMVESEGGEEPAAEICVMSSESDMPHMTPDDLGWVYVSISGEEFSEAVAVVVTDEGGEARIRELEWGRP